MIPASSRIKESSPFCTSCSSTNTVKRGKDVRFGVIFQRYSCKDCSCNFYHDCNADGEGHQETDTSFFDAIDSNYTKPSAVPGNKTWVITSAVSDIPVYKEGLSTLLGYCEHNDAEFMVIPLKYKLHGLAEADKEYSWAKEVTDYLVRDTLRLTDNLVLLAGVRVSPSIGNPLTGFEAFSKGDSLIIGHPQIAMKTVAMSHVDPSAIITTTGCITNPVYTDTKQGEKAAFNHSFGAIVIEQDGDDFHYRVLHIDRKGELYDLDRVYSGKFMAPVRAIPALIVGDEHIFSIDPSVTTATFSDPDSIVNKLRPEVIVRHDSLDFYSGSHHHKHNVFTNYAKHHSGADDIASELRLTIDYISRTTPDFSKSVIVSSNHNEHLLRWLNECNPKTDHRNARLYHELMYLMLGKTTMGESGTVHPDPFALWTKHNYQSTDHIEFLSSFESFKIKGIELSMHGHAGANGARGNIVGFSKLGLKTVTGHSHSPQIFGGAYSVGHSCRSKLEYNGGPSSWAQCHVIIYDNGKRTPIFIKNGKWKR